METLKFIEQKHLIRKKDIIKEILLSLFLGISTFLCFQEMFRFTLNFSEEYRGGIRSGFVYTWNQIVDVLGNENYILLPKFSGAGKGNAIFLIVLLFLFSVVYFLFIHGRNRWAIYVISLFLIIFSGVTNLQISMETVLFFVITVVAGVLYARDQNGLCNKLCLFIFTIIVCAIIFSSSIGKKINAKSETLCKIQNMIQTKVEENYYGSNLLKNGDLRQRKREKSEKEAFEITMKNPQSIYLRGFVGENYKDNQWETLPNYNYYKENDFFYWLEKENFHALGQLGQAKNLVNKEKIEKENEITIQVKEADSRYAYIPYEMKGKISAGKTWGGSFVSTSPFNRLTNYKYNMGENAVKTWTDTAAKMFLLAETETVKDYLRNESNYNAYVYQNFTYLSKKEKSILNTYIGKAGDQSKGHIDYKPAIIGVQKYLEDNFIYTENLGEKTEHGKSMLEDFLASKKGYDVQFATAATLIFRYYGIPARYVEGYLVTPKDVKEMESGKAKTIPKSNAHAWVEIYIDGTGFVPIEVSPPYRKIMEEADMEIGISNNALVRPFDNKGAVSKQTEETESAGDNKKHITFSVMAIICIFIILFLLIVCLKFLWKYFVCFKEYLKRRKLFHKAIPKQAVSAIYSYMEDKEYPIEDKVRILGNKAAYSKEELSEEERKEMLIALKDAAKEKKKNDQKIKSILISILVIAMMLCGCGTKNLVDNIDEQTKKTAEYVKEKVPNPNISAIGGEWAVRGIAESGIEVDNSYFEVYYDTVRAKVKSQKGKIHEEYYSDYARVILALNAIGKDPKNVEGFDLTKPLEEYEELTKQGVNAVAYTLVAINECNVSLEHEQAYVKFLVKEMENMLTEQNKRDMDFISMGLFGLSFYQDDVTVKKVIEDSIKYLSNMQQENGTMGSCESTSEAIIALTQVEVNVFYDKRFVKKEGSLGESLMNYQVDKGGFLHMEDGETADEMATEKALLALCSMKKMEKGGLYERKE